MQLQNIHLKNFGIIRSAQMDFQPGVNLISGNNGEGKSTIIKALSLILFNYTKGNLNDYVNDFAKDFHIESEFILLGKKHGFEMDYNLDGGSSKKLLVEGVSEPYKNSDVAKYMSSVIEPKYGRASMISFEKDIDVIRSKPAERRDVLKKILEVEFPQAIQDVSEEIKKLEKEYNDSKIEIDVLKRIDYTPKEEKELPLSKIDVKNYELALKDLLANQSSIEYQIENFNRKKKELEDLQEEVNEIIDELEELESKKLSAEQFIDGVSEEITRETKKYEEDADFSKKTHIKARNDLCKQSEELQGASEAIQLVRVLPFNESELENTLVALQEAQHTEKDLLHKKSLIESGMCPTCERPFHGEDSSKIEEDLRVIRDSIAFAQKLVADLKQKKSEYEKKVKEEAEKTQKKLELNSKIEKLDERLSSLEESNARSLKTLEDNLRSFIENQNKLKKIYESNISEYSKSIDHYKNKLPSLRSEIGSLKEDLPVEEPKQNPEEERRISEIQQMLRDYQEIIAYNESIKKINKEILENKTNNEKHIEELNSRMEEIAELLKVDNTSLSLLKNDFPKFIISDKLKKMTKAMNSFVQQAYHKQQLLTVKEDLSLVYGPRDRDISLSSGYEQEVFSFAYKHVINNLGLMLLDEADSVASEENTELFYYTLARMTELYEQIIVITHKEDAKEYLVKDFDAAAFLAKDGVIERIA